MLLSQTLQRSPVCPVSGQSVLEERLNTLIHGLGLLVFAGGTALLIVLASLWNSPWHIVGVSIFGASLVVLYGISTLYHSAASLRWKRALRVADHVAIFLLIGGTYTPFMLVPLRGGWGWSLFGVVWGFAVLGILFKLFFTGRFEVVSTIMYVLLGWVIVIAFAPLLESLPLGGILGLLAGGVAYTLGAAFFIWDERVPFFHTVFHLLVLTGSALHFWVVLRYVL